MKQDEIMGLLQEAAHPACSHERHNQIASLLCRGTAVQAINSEDQDYAQGIRHVVVSVFTDVAANRRQALPGLFPLFALYCSNRFEEVAHAGHVQYWLMDADTAVELGSYTLPKDQEPTFKLSISPDLLEETVDLGAMPIPTS